MPYASDLPQQAAALNLDEAMPEVPQNQAPAAGNLPSIQDPDGKFSCPFCPSRVSSKSYLARHTRRDHEGCTDFLGPEMVVYLHCMSRWMCGGCLRTSPNSKDHCDECLTDRCDCEIDGDATQVEPIAPAAADTPIQQDSQPQVMDTVVDELVCDLNTIFANECTNLVEHIPVKCRVKWAAVLTEELDKVTSQNTVSAWTRMLMLSKSVLWIPRTSRGGRNSRGKNSLASIISNRLDRWQRGEHNALWNEFVSQNAKMAPKKASALDEARVRRARRLAGEGLFSKACDALTSQGLHSKSDVVVSKLEALHPKGRSISPSLLEEEAVLDFEASDVAKALDSFPKRSGAGRSGLKPQHLKDAASCKSPVIQERFLGRLTRFVNFLTAGEAITDVSPYVGGAPLMALIKDDDGVRPIAIGETFRRLASKCCTRHEIVLETCQRLLEPTQVGVGLPGGGEAMARAVSAITHEKGQDPDMALLKIDLRNAFNCISRKVFLEEIDKEIPELSQWARWCYGSKSNLWFHDVVIESSEGVQQGDPLGPLLFSLGLRRITSAIKERFPNLALQTWYLDDGVLIGKREDLAAVLFYLGTEAVQEMGFHLNLTKCEVWWPSGDRSFPQMPPEIQRQTEGVEILKLPIGSDDFVLQSLQKRVQRMTSILDKLGMLEDSHIEFTILRACLGAAKLTYALRGIPPSDAVIRILREADDLLRRALERILADSVPEGAWKQAGMTPSCGGMGLRYLEDLCVPAFIGAATDTADLTLRILQTNSTNVPGLQQAAQRYIDMQLGTHVPMNIGVTVGKLAREALSREAVEDMPKKGQAVLQDAWDEWQFEYLRQNAAGNDRDRLDACKRSHASAWISCFPNRALGLHLPDREFRVATRYWLGLTKRMENRSVLRPGFGMYGRHHAVQECLLGLCVSAGVPAKREILIDTSGQRPADVFLPNFFRGTSVAIDVTVSHPSQSTAIASDGASQRRSASERAALDKVDSKHRKYQTQCDARGVHFQAVAVCSFGGWLPNGEDLIKELARRAVGRGGGDFGAILSQYWQRLSLALWRGNARQILHCLT